MDGPLPGGALKAATAKSRAPKVVLALVPLLLLGALIAFLALRGPAGIFPGDFPAIEDLTVGRVDIEGDQIKLVVTNGGPAPVTIAQVLVDDAYWQHTVEPSRTIERLRNATVTVLYPSVAGEPINLALVTSTGLTFEHTIEVATESPAVDARFLWTFALLGIYIGVIPVALGMTSIPFLRTLSPRWLLFFMAFAAGVLVFLGVETIAEALEESSELPTAFGGVGIVSVSAIGAFAVILAASRQFQAKTTRDRRVAVAFAVAGGIGLHNLGEGLAVGAAYRLGEIALGAFLVIGFAIHNTTEGLGIVSILGDSRTRIRTLIVLGVIAGAPTILGAWGGAFLFSPLLATVFLGIAAGAIAEVIIEVMRVVRDQAAGGLASLESLGGLAAGLVVMYATGLFVAA